MMPHESGLSSHQSLSMAVMPAAGHTASASVWRERVGVQWGKRRRTSGLHAHGKRRKAVAALKQRHFNGRRFHVAVCRGGVESALADDFRVQLRDRHHGVEIIVQARGQVARATTEAFFKLLFALDLVLWQEGEEGESSGRRGARRGEGAGKEGDGRTSKHMETSKAKL